MSITKVKRNKMTPSEKLKKFIDFDREKQVFFNNLYIEDFKIVLKQPLVIGQRNTKDVADLKVEKFNLTKYTFLTSY
ncbi:MAG: hypothetical protein ACOC44_11745 [Promethearchaeia archaeon]